MQLIINPGTEPIDGANEQNAADNMKHFIVDCSVKGLKYVRVPEEDGGYAKEGRFAFLVYVVGRNINRCYLVHMPGLPLEKVRYMGEGEQNIFNFPRLYVDKSSWVWMYALLTEDSFEGNGEE